MLRYNLFYSTLIETLSERNQHEAGELINALMARSMNNVHLTQALQDWTKTIDVDALSRLFVRPVKCTSSAELNDVFNQICLAGRVAQQRLKQTGRDMHNRLFPSMDDGRGWSLSLQGDKSGYMCLPRSKLQYLQDYVSVEAAIYGPGFTSSTECLKALELPKSSREKFFDDKDNMPLIGGNLTWNDIALVRERLSTLRAATHVRLVAIDDEEFSYSVTYGAGLHFWSAEFYGRDNLENAVEDLMDRMERHDLPGSVIIRPAGIRIADETPSGLVSRVDQSLDDDLLSVSDEAERAVARSNHPLFEICQAFNRSHEEKSGLEMTFS